MVTPDAIFALFIAATIYCVVRGYQQQKSRRAWFAGVWIAAGFASLAKGPGALVYLAAICGLLAIPFREARLRFRLLLHWRNLLLFVLLVAPWFVWAHQNFPGFLSHFPGRTDVTASLPRWRFLLVHFAWWFPAILLVLPGLILAPRKIFRPNEFAFADALPLVWIAVGLLVPALGGERHVYSSLAAAPGFALFAANSWERTSRPLRVGGIALALVMGVATAAATYYRPAVAAGFLDRAINTSTWTFLTPLAQIAVGSLVAFAIGALLIVKQRGEITLVVALAAMVPVGFCLVEARSQAAPFFSLADAVKYLNPRLGRNGEVVYEGSLPSGNSLSFYLDKRFFLVNQAPAFFDRDPAAQNKYLDEHFLTEAWDGSNPIYLIIDEARVSYWRKRITTRVHIYHQVSTCGSRVILSNQL